MRRDDEDTGADVDREEPVGAPVVRGDPEITGPRAAEALTFDPDDPESLSEAASIVREFVADPPPDDQIEMLRGAAACAALVRGEGSYTAAANRAGDDVTVSILRKWARVHDLPIAIRRHIAAGDIPPTAAMHLARVTGTARFLLAWTILDNELTVEEVREIVSAVAAGEDMETVLAQHDMTLGQITLVLPPASYRELRRVASMEKVAPGTVVAKALDSYDTEADSPRS